MKKALSMILALAMLLSMVTGIALGEEEKPTITILMDVSTNITDIETNAYTQHLEEVFNCNLDFVALPSANSGDKLAMMLTSGEELPYVLNYGLSLEKTYQYAQAGAFIPLTEYYSDPEFNANLVAVEEKVPGIYKYITCPDGEIYAIPFYQRELHSNVQNKIWLNYGWLETLGLEEPTTTDELYEVLKAFVNNDPNGNGIADEIGLIGNKSGSQADLTVFLMNAFIYDDDSDHFTLTDGVVDVAYDKEAWKQGLLYMKKLYDENLIYHDSFTQDRATEKALALQDDPMICSGFALSSISLIDDSTEAWRSYEGLEPLTGPEGVSYARYNTSYAESHWFVTKDCPEELRDLAVQIGIFMFDPTEEEFILNRFGVEGVDWERPQTDVSKYEGFPARYYQLHVIWNKEENSHWQKNGPMFALDVDQGEWDDGDSTNWNHKVPHAVVKYMTHLPKDGEYVPKLIYTEDELDEISEIQSNLQTYVDEMKVLFITGQKDIEKDWDSYLEELNKIGYKQFIEVAQTVYDRMYANK